MENDEETTWPFDLEALVAKSVRRLREGRGISQQQLGVDLARYGVGMHQTTVAKLEAGSKPLRLNEVLAIAAYFKVPIESLWTEGGEILNEHEMSVIREEMRTVEAALEEAHAEVMEADRGRVRAEILARTAHDIAVRLNKRRRGLVERLAAAQGVDYVQH